MSALEAIEQKLLALPVSDRVFLAESLLDSVAEDTAAMTPEQELAEAKRRNNEIESGKVRPLTEDEFWAGLE